MFFQLIFLFETQDRGRSVQLWFMSSFLFRDLWLDASYNLTSFSKWLHAGDFVERGNVPWKCHDGWASFIMPFLLQTQQSLACGLCSLLFIGHQQPSINNHCSPNKRTHREIMFYLNIVERTAIMSFCLFVRKSNYPIILTLWALVCLRKDF